MLDSPGAVSGALAGAAASSAEGGRGGRRGRPVLRDLILVACLPVAMFLVASRGEFHERFSRWVAGYERWEADELPLALLALSLGLGWFAWRRWREQRAEALARGRAEQRIAALLGRNRELARSLLTLQEEERRAIARDLHDELGQSCNAIRVDAACILNRGADGTEGAAVSASARAIADTADGLYQAIHRLLRQLRPPALDAAGLVAAIGDLCQGWERRHGIACSVSCGEGLDDLAEPVAITAFRVVQEALTNAARHAQADWVRVDLTISRTAGAQRLRVAIRDNGRGLPCGARGGGFGLLGMQERVGALGGDLRIASSPGEGVCIEASLPLAQTA